MRMLRIRRGEPTETRRLGAFSDSVFAVAITLLVLDLSRIHANPYATPPVSLFQSMASDWPTLLAFAGAFGFIGVAWTHHHGVFVRVKGVSRALNAANLVLLGTIIMVPWATSSLAAALGDSADPAARQAVLLYAAVIMACALTWGLLYHVLGSNPGLLSDPTHAPGFLADRTGTLIALGTTAIAAAIGYFWSPIAGAILFAIVPVIFAVASEGFFWDEQSGVTK